MLIVLVLGMHLGLLSSAFLCGWVTFIKLLMLLLPVWCLAVHSNTKRPIWDVCIWRIAALREPAKRASDDSAAPDVCNHHFTSSAASISTQCRSVFQKYLSIRYAVLLQEGWELLMHFKILKRDVHFTITSWISIHTVCPLLKITFLEGALNLRKACDMSSEAWTCSCSNPHHHHLRWSRQM